MKFHKLNALERSSRVGILWNQISKHPIVSLKKRKENESAALGFDAVFFIFLSVPAETCHFDFLLLSVNNNRVRNLRGRYWSGGFFFLSEHRVFHLRTTILPAEEDFPAIMSSFKRFNDSFMEQYEGYSRLWARTETRDYRSEEESIDWKLISYCNSLEKQVVRGLLFIE